MTLPTYQESHHGVLMNIQGQGVLIKGAAGIGKSSFALELLHHGHQFIADDIVDVQQNETQQIVGRSPDMLTNLLHTRELGLINVEHAFGAQAIKSSTAIHYIVQLESTSQMNSSLTPEHQTPLCGKMFPTLILSIHNPASLYYRVLTWLNMQQIEQSKAEKLLKQRQKEQISST